MTHAKMPPMAVIYARVSSVSQTKRGDGLGSQETRCREFAKAKGYHVTKVFKDDTTGAIITRPGIKDMLAYLDKNRAVNPIVIIDDVSRLARDVTTHWELRSTIERAGGTLTSPSIEFGEDSDSILVENLLASVSQHQRQKNGEQVKNRMRSRILNGYWCFQAPVGYKYKQKSGQGKVLTRDEPIASILQEALEGYASGRLEAQSDVRNYLHSRPEYPKEKKSGTVHPQRIPEILSRSLYAGMVESPKWNVSLRKGHHEPIISLKTYERIQERLTGGAKAPARTELREDFPLRGAVTCADCGKPLTACWSAGKRQKYPYYLCHNKDCISHRKSIRKEQIENDFERLLKRLVPSSALIATFHALIQDVWDQRTQQEQTSRTTLEIELRDNEAEITSFVERIVETTSPTVIAAYEKRIQQLEMRKLVLDEQITTKAQPRISFEETFEHAIRFLANPLRLWQSDDYEDKRTVLKLTFSNHLAYCRNEGFRTPDLSIPFKALGSIFMSEKVMVHQHGFELNTLFDDLANWEEILKYSKASLKDAS